jgi:hypothetical protein
MRFPNPSQHRVVQMAFVAAVFIILGVVALAKGFRAPAEKHELAVALEHRGFWYLGIGVAIAAYWLYRRFRDY